MRQDISFDIKKDSPTKFEDALRKAKNIEIAISGMSAGEVNNATENSQSKLYETLINMSQEYKYKNCFKTR